MSTSGSTRYGGVGTSGARSPSLMSPTLHSYAAQPSSSSSSKVRSSMVATIDTRPPSSASRSSRGGGGGGGNTVAHASSPSYSSVARRRRLEDLVLATVPAARPRRSEMDVQRVEERNAFRADLVDYLEDHLTAHAQSASALPDQTHTITQLKQKLARHDVDGAQGSSLRLESLIAKLKRQPDVAQNVDGLLQMLESLAFSSRRTSFSVDGAIPRSNSTLLNVPDVSRSSRRSQLRDGRFHEARRASASERSREPTPAPPDSPKTDREAIKQESKTKDHQGQTEIKRIPVLTEDDLNVPKATLLQRWRAKNGLTLIPEVELLNDVIYLLQGINGKHVGFEDDILAASNDVGETREAEKIVRVQFYSDAEEKITEPTKELIHQVVELGRLYKRIDEFQRQRSQLQGVGLIMQSLCHFLSSELTDYYRLIALLETQMKQQHQDQPSDDAPKRSNPSSLTLRRVAVWTQDVLLRMRLISTLIESCQDAHGGAIVSLIHSYTFHGDPLIQKFTAEILDHVAKPFFHMISLWIFEGELQDPFEEFFVEANKDLKAAWTPTNGGLDDGANVLYMSTSQDNVAPPSSLWQNQFRFRAEMLPSFLDETFGKKIFSAGKSLNFIRFSCGDAEWVTANVASAYDKRSPLRYANLPGLQTTIDEAYASSSTRLLDIFLGKFKLMTHLRALKDYLMLTKGDFTDLLMESIGPSLDKPASSLFRHNLTASLETSIRGSNSQYDEADIVGRLDARILDFNEGDLGWEGFTLEYRVDEPVSTVLDTHSMLGYQVIFTHLWKMKRVELTLGRGWERLLLAANLLRRAQPRTIKRSTIVRRGGSFASAGVSDEDKEASSTSAQQRLIRTAHETLGRLSEQIHFVKQMQGFISLEVIEYSWTDLTQLFASHTAKKRLIDLDELITSHRAYLNALIAKIMLRGSTAGSSGKRSDQLALEVKATLDVMLTFATAVEDLARMINDEIARHELDAKNNVSASSAPSDDLSSSLANLQSRLTSTHVKFQTSTQAIIAKLEKHSNLVVRDLATRLNFNSFYNTAAQQANASGSAIGQNRRGGGGGQANMGSG